MNDKSEKSITFNYLRIDVFKKLASKASNNKSDVGKPPAGGPKF